MKSGPLYATLTNSVRHRRLSLALRWLLLAASLALLALTLAFVADNLFNLPPWLRTTIATTTLLSLPLTLATLLIRHLRHCTDLTKAARYLEERHNITDNHLVNAVCFAADPNLHPTLKQYFTHQAENTCRTFKLRTIWRHAHFKPIIRLTLAALLLTLAYTTLFNHHAHNALLRFTSPASTLTPLNFTQFEVTPGDLRLPENHSCTIHATARKYNTPASHLEILVSSGTTPLLYPMRLDNNTHSFTLTSLTRNTRYAIRHGNDRTRWFDITITPKPQLHNLTITLTPPPYTTAPPQTIPATTRQITAVTGTHISISATPHSKKHHLRFIHNNSPITTPDHKLELTLDSETTLALDITDHHQITHTALWQCTFTPVNDTPPEVRLTNRDLNQRATPGETLLLNLNQRDDFGITALELFTRQGDEEITLKTISYHELRRERQETTPLLLTAEHFAHHASYRIWARVYDNFDPPQHSISPTPLTLHITDPATTLEGDESDPQVRLFATLTTALKLQSETRDWLAADIGADRHTPLSPKLNERQTAVYNHIRTGWQLSRELLQHKRLRAAFAAQLASIHTDHAAPLQQHLPTVAQLQPEPRQAALNDVVLRQTTIATALRRLLGVLSADRALQRQQEQELATDDQDQNFFDKLEQLRRDLAKFQEEQRRLIADTEAIDKKEPEDWTEEEEKLLGDLATRQQEWAKLFRSAFNDLSKVENQDFSNSFMADELIEMIEELQRSGAALEKKHIEIATVNEELLGQQANSIEANLERWLADAKDHIRWIGEEGGVSPDVPLQDLPAELTDIIGELIDQAEDMEDVEDSTNSSLSAFDDGLGWGVSDGNMDNMSARGITGNVLPNNNEVGGRSGEGRSGKSTGQFVEKEATGKGGRDTPTRLVQSPFERGTVRDLSKDPQGGATGGGKQSGLGGEGLRGITPDQKPDVDQRLPGQQAEFKQKAEALIRELAVRNLPTADLESAVKRMELIQQLNPRGEGLQLRQLQNEMISSLRDARTVMATTATTATQTRKASARNISTIRATDQEPTPKDYESSVNAYFRALTQPPDE